MAYGRNFTVYRNWSINFDEINALQVVTTLNQPSILPKYN